MTTCERERVLMCIHARKPNIIDTHSYLNVELKNNLKRKYNFTAAEKSPSLKHSPGVFDFILSSIIHARARSYSKKLSSSLKAS